MKSFDLEESTDLRKPIFGSETFGTKVYKQGSVILKHNSLSGCRAKSLNS